MTTAASSSGTPSLQSLMDACVHCGFCLSTCPSYLVSGRETESPRGRIYIMRALAEERMPLDARVVEHFDTCLGCVACETACPSGVRYGPLIEHTRAEIERHHKRPLTERLFRRLLFTLLPYPKRLRWLAPGLGLARMLAKRPGLLAPLPARLRQLISLAPASTAGGPAIPAHTPAVGDVRRRVSLVTGCVQSIFFESVNRASVRVLAAEGCDVSVPVDQGCCGALSLHAGRDEDARAFARQLIERFDASGADEIVVNAAGCGSTIKSYGELLAGDPEWAARARTFASRVRDITETLASLLPARAPRRPLNMRVAYHDACHLAHAQGVRREPRDVLASIPGLTIVPVADVDICCGSAGLFNLLEPGLASELGRRKAARIAEANPDLVVTSNPGCLLQMTAAAREAGDSRPMCHVVELLDRSVHGTMT